MKLNPNNKIFVYLIGMFLLYSYSVISIASNLVIRKDFNYINQISPLFSLLLTFFGLFKSLFFIFLFRHETDC